MPLTLKWWTDLKGKTEYKVNGNAAPETEFEKKLKAYDKLRATLTTPAEVAAAELALLAVENARRASATALAGFPKLAAEIGANSGRLLNTKITEDKNALATTKKQLAATAAAEAKAQEAAAAEAAKKQKAAIREIGSPKMSGLGHEKPPEERTERGTTIREGTFKRIQASLKQFIEGVKKSKTMEKADIDRHSSFLLEMKKDVTNYCSDRPNARPFLDAYSDAIVALNKTKDNWGKNDKRDQAFKTFGTHVSSMVNAKYVP